MSTNKKRVEFTFFAPDAELILLSGSLNDWSDGSDPMKKDKTGIWKKTKLLGKGTYEYKFIVDDVWMLDPNCHDTVPNQYGTDNNIIEVYGSVTNLDQTEVNLFKRR